MKIGFPCKHDRITHYYRALATPQAQGMGMINKNDEQNVTHLKIVLDCVPCFCYMASQNVQPMHALTVYMVIA